MKIGDFVHHECDPKTEKMKLLIIDDLCDGMLLCRYVHHNELRTEPERKFHTSELIGVKI